MTLAELLARAARRRPEADAVVDGAARLTYAELERQTAALAGGFARVGVAGGDRVLIALKNRLEHVLAYWTLPRLSGVIRDGWYFTGDMGWIDADGELWMAGRVDDMIITGGENIHPVEVEEVLARHPGVRDVAVVGEPDERWGERVVAFVVPAAADLTAEALDRYCREQPDLGRFKRPRRVVFVGAIPRPASGKILRRLLREGKHTETPP